MILQYNYMQYDSVTAGILGGHFEREESDGKWRDKSAGITYYIGTFYLSISNPV